MSEPSSENTPMPDPSGETENPVATASSEGEETTNPEEEVSARDALISWVEDTLARIESPSSKDRTWCPQWWDHPEAVDRFSALHRQYVECLADGSLSSWWVDHWDRHAPQLFAREGVFEQCRATGHKMESERARLLPTEMPPADWQP